MMVLQPRNIILPLWFALAVLLHGQGFADAVVSTRIASGTPGLAGTTFTVAVDVASDAEVPHAVALRLSYPTDSVEYLGITDGVLGQATTGAVEGTAPNVFRNIATIGDSDHAGLTATAFSVEFRTLIEAAGNFDIVIAADDNTPANVIGANPFPTLPATYDSSATLGLGNPIAKAAIATAISNSNPAPGETFTVTINTLSNPYAVDVLAATVRVGFDNSVLEFLGVNSGQVGTVTAGGVQGTSPNNFVNLASLGPDDLNDAVQTPVISTLSFRVRPTIVATTSITVGNNPDATSPLVAVGTTAPLYADYDNSATTNIALDLATALIASSVSVAPSNVGDLFDVVIAVTENDTLFAPSSFALRVNYNANLIAFDSVLDGDLGPVFVGNEMGTAPNNYRNVASLGNVPNSDFLVTLGTLRFRVLDCIGSGDAVSVILSEDADADDVLLSIDVPNSQIVAIPSAFDSTLSTGFTVTPNPAIFAFASSGINFSGTERLPIAASSVTLNNNSACPVSVSISSDAAWLSVAPLSANIAGSGSQIVNLTVNNAGLAAGVYNATVTATSGSVSETVNVVLTLDALPVVTIASSVDAAPVNAGDIFKVSVAVTANDTTTTPTSGVVRLNFNSDLVAVVLGSEEDGDLGPVSISNVLGTTPNNYITIASLGDVNNTNPLPVLGSVSFKVLDCVSGADSISVTLSEETSAISPILALIVSPPTELNLLANFDSSATTGFSVNPRAAEILFASAGATVTGVERESVAGGSVALNNTGICPVSVTFASNVAWLSVNPASANLIAGGSATISYTIDTTGLAAGTYIGAITATDILDTTSTQFDVTLILTALPVVEVATSIDVLPSSAGDTFSISLAVVGNDSGTTPTAAALRLSFDASIVEYVAGSAIDGDLGPVSVSPVLGTSPNNFINVATLGDVTNENALPLIASLGFKVNECIAAGSVFSIIASEDTNADSPFLQIVIVPPSEQKILANFDSSATEDISVSPLTDLIAFLPAGPLSFNVNEGDGLAPTIVEVANNATCDTVASLSSDAAWLTVVPTSVDVAATSSTAVSLNYDLSSLVPGSVNVATVTATTAKGGLATLQVSVTIIEAPVIGLDIASIVRTIDTGTTATAAFVVTNLGGQVLNYVASANVDWISLTPSAGSLTAATTDTVTVLLDATMLAAGQTFNGTITVADANARNNPQTISVTLNVVGGLATIAAAPAAITRSINEGVTAAPATISLSNTGTNILNYTATTTASWLSVAPVAGSLNPAGGQALTVTFDTASLPPTPAGAPLTAAVVIAAPNVSNPGGQVTIPVTLTIINVIDPAVIASSVISGNPCVPGSEFVVRYRVATNGETNLIARNFTFAVEYNTNAIEFVSAVRGQLGALTVVNNPPAATAPNNATYVLSSNFFLGNPNNATPVLADVTFRVRETGFLAPYSITMAPFNSNFPLTGGAPVTTCSMATPCIGSTQIPSVFDASATSNLGLCPILNVTPNSFAYAIEFGDGLASAAAVVANLGNATLNYTASSNSAWLSVAPLTGSVAPLTSGALTLSFNTASLPGGNFTGIVTVADPAAVFSPATITVNLTVNDPFPPTLTIDTTEFTKVIDERTTALPETVILGAEGTSGALLYSLSSNASWLSAAPADGLIDLGTTTTVTLSFTTDALAPGEYTGVVTATGNFENSPQTITVALTVIDIITPPATSVSFSFDTDSEGWTFDSPVLDLAGIGLSDEGFSNDGAIAGSLDLLTSSTKTFAYWSSPRFYVLEDADNLPVGGIAIGGTTGDDSLFRLAVNISTDVTSKALVPTFRLRTSAWDWQQADVLVVTSVEDFSAAALEFLPDANGRDYVQHFTQPASSDSFRVDIDVTNFIPLDQAVATLKINQVDITALSQSGLASFEAEIVSIDLTAGNPGFTAGTLPDLFAEPLFTEDENGLGIVGTGFSVLPKNEFVPNPTPIVAYGAWELAAFDNTFAGGAVYRVDFTVASDAVDPSAVPTFRLRVNSSSQVFASYVNVNSSNASSNVPTAGNPVTYSMFIETPAEIGGDFWIFAFEYIYAEITDDDPNAAIYLQNLTVTELSN